MLICKVQTESGRDSVEESSYHLCSVSGSKLLVMGVGKRGDSTRRLLCG
jgi:hypothetical protein